MAEEETEDVSELEELIDVVLEPLAESVPFAEAVPLCLDEPESNHDTLSAAVKVCFDVSVAVCVRV